MKLDGGGLAGIAFFALEECSAGGETAEGVGKGWTDGSSVIEGENPIVLGDLEQFLRGVGKGEQGRRRRIDQGTEHAGGGGLAAGGWTIKNQDRMCTGWTEGREQPDGQARTVGVSREIESRRKKAGVGRRRLRNWVWEFGVAAAVEEGGRWVGSDLPAGGCDFDDFALGIAEIEKNGIGLARIAASSDTPMYRKAWSARKGAGLESADGLAEGIVAGRLAVLAIESVDEPVAETG